MRIPLQNLRQKIGSLVTDKPWASFAVLLIALFAVIFISHTLRAPEVPAESAPLPPKKVILFSPQDDSVTVTVPAQIKKDSILRITALTPGIVSGIFINPGQGVSAGRTLFTLTNDYNSGAAAIEKQIAQNDTALAEEVAVLDKKIQALEERRIKRDQTLSGSAEDVALAELRKDRNTRDYALTKSRLGLALALRNDAVLQPKSPLSGVITSIAIRRGQFVNAGDTLATLAASGTTPTIEALLSSDTARLIDPAQEASLTLSNGDTLPLTLIYLATQENADGLYSVLYSLPADTAQKMLDNHYTDIRIALKSQSGNILLPLESISQDAESAWVMVERDGKATAAAITLGTIFGNAIEVTSGIDATARVILSRGIIEGEAITTE
jgi:multidrug efflux pump subunit AcrA (membrane-fusion protein)